MPVTKADPQGMGSAMTYARRYALSAMLGIISEEDLDGEDAKPQPRSTSYKTNAKTSSIKSSNTPPPPKASQKASSSTHANTLENLKGVVYESVETQDDDGNIREVITASGNTIPNKEKLMEAGFRWSQSRKIWWKYADAI